VGKEPKEMELGRGKEKAKMKARGKKKEPKRKRKKKTTDRGRKEKVQKERKALTLHRVQHHGGRRRHHVPRPALCLGGQLPGLPARIPAQQPERACRGASRRDQRVGRGEPPGVDAADHLVRPLESGGSCFLVGRGCIFGGRGRVGDGERKSGKKGRER